jgi:hypothetical protein
MPPLLPPRGVGDGILTEGGDHILTEDGSNILVEA